MNPQQQFLAWLEANDPFVYDVVKEKLASEGTFLDGWSDILSSVGKAVITIAPAYVGYKQSRDANKLAKAQLRFQQRQVAPPPPPRR